jgi:hypothetical protein
MGIAFPPQDNLDESPVRVDQSTDHVLPLLEEDAWLGEDESPLWGDEHTDNVLSLLEENARLRRLVVTLSNLILRNAADQR